MPHEYYRLEQDGGVTTTTLSTRRRFAASTMSAALLSSVARAVTPTRLTFSYQRSSALLIVLMTNGELTRRLAAAGYRPDFAQFERIIDAMSANVVTFHGDVADCVPIFVQAAGAPLAYYAMEKGSPSAEALIVPSASPVRTIADLRGQSVAVSKGSGAHYMLLELLKRAGLTLTDVRPAYLEASDGSAAFRSGKVAAWATWDPFLAISESQQPVRVLGDGTGVTSYNRYYMVDAAFARAHPDVVGIVYQSLLSASDWIHANSEAAATLLSPLWGRAPLEVVTRIDARRGYRIQPVDAAAIAEQQHIADTFLEAGLIPERLRVADVPVWRPTGA